MRMIEDTEASWKQRWFELAPQHVLRQLVVAIEHWPLVEAVPDAAVLMGLTLEQEPRLLLTQRSHQLSAHAGEVAFPGGKCDVQDSDIEATALRESWEEMGVYPEHVWIVGKTGVYVSRAGLTVQPVLGFLAPDIPLQSNPNEIAHMFWVPLQFFLQTRPSYDYEVQFMDQRYVMPCFRYEGFVIWGLTAYMWVDVLNRALGVDIDFPMPRPVRA